MLELKPRFRQAHRKGEYPRLEDIGLIGDGTTAALVSLDGSISWLCLPRFDSEPVFCGLLDVAKGGHFILAPEEIVEVRQYYEPDTAVLHTEFQTTNGRVRVTDAMAVRAGADLTDDASGGRAELVRSAAVLEGSVQLRVEFKPRGGESVQPTAGGLHIRPSSFSHIGVIASGVMLERAHL
jgi:GH15 family glucan-1,4-alpha-glucosidase